MIRFLHIAALSAVLLATVGVGSASVSAQTADVGVGGPGDADMHQKIIFLPPRDGALSLQVDIGGRFALSDDEDLPDASYGGSLGWRQFLDPHGKASLRLYGQLRYGGLAPPQIHGELWQVGGGASLLLRGYDLKYFFVGIGTYAEIDGLHWRPPTGHTPDSVDGWRTGFGLETTIGQLFYADPYLFAETGATAGFSYLELGVISLWSVEGQWIVRFDWAL